MRVFRNLIVIDGLDGVGKTSTVSALKKELTRLGFNVITKSFEKGFFQSAFTEARKSNDPNIKYFLQLAALSKLSEEIISTPSEKIIISDRYMYSVNAYYSALPRVKRISNPVPFFTMPEPQLKVLLECSSEIRKQRMLSRSKYISERKAQTLASFGDRIQSILLTYPKWVRINNEELTISDVVSQIMFQYN